MRLYSRARDNWQAMVSSDTAPADLDQKGVGDKANNLSVQMIATPHWQTSLVIRMIGQSSPTANLQMIQNWEEDLIDQIFLLLLRGTSTGWSNGPTGTSYAVQESKIRSPAPGEE